MSSMHNNNSNFSSRTGRYCFAVIGMLLSLMVSDAVGQSYVELEEARMETTVKEKIGKQVPLEARFKWTDANWYSLNEFFYQDRPVFLSLNYANCPQLCQNQLKLVAEKLEEAGLVPGRDLEFISISLDPREAESKTMEAQDNFLRMAGLKQSNKGVHFLVGNRENIDMVAEAVGFVYQYLPAADHYSHAPLVVVLSPDGKISRYVHGLAFTADDLKESATIAAKGEVAEESVASFVFRCLLYGVNPGQYTKDLMGLMKIAGAATVIIIGACVIPFWFRSPPATQSNDQDSPKAKVTSVEANSQSDDS